MFPFQDDIGGTIRGYRVFTACRTTNGKIFRLDDHLSRLFSSASGIYMQPPMPEPKLKEVLQELVRRNLEADPGKELLLEIIFSGGLDGAGMKQSGNGAHLYIATQELVPPTKEMYDKGVALATFVHQRLMPDIKLLNYVGAIVAHQTVVPEHDAFDVLFLDPSDNDSILEGSTFTVFFVDASGRIVTPPLDGRILDSITRRALIELLRPFPDLRVIERPVGLSELNSSLSEAFIASTTRSVLSVTRINHTRIGEGAPGKITRRAAEIFRDYLSAY